MKALKHFIYSFVVILLLCGVAEAQTLFGAAHLGSDGPSTFFELNPLTGAAVATGPIGFERCGSMDFSPAGTLFGICERLDGSDTQVLVTINPRTGVGTEVGPLNSCEIFFDMAFRDDGTVFASGFDNEEVVGGPCPFENITLITIDTATGAGTVVGPLVAEPDGIRSGQAGNGLAFRDDGTLFYSAFNFESEPPRPSLYTVNQVTGAATLVTNETFPPGANDIPRTNALDFNPETGALFASIVNGGRGGILLIS